MTASTVRWSGWLGYVFVGVTVGLLAAVGQRAGFWTEGVGWVGGGFGWLNDAVGPVWVPMGALACRVGALTARAASTRSGRRIARAASTRELEHLAPLFTGLGFAGTVWGMWMGFGSLEGGQLLEKLPVLLQGIGAAMTSTLVGLALWAATLSLAAWVPSWTWARVTWTGDSLYFSLDERNLGSGESGLDALVEAIRGRQPEALCLAFDRSVPTDRKAMIATAVWSQRDADLPYQELIR